MIPPQRLRTSLIGAAILAATLLHAACGGTTNEPTPGSAPSDASGTPTATPALFGSPPTTTTTATPTPGETTVPASPAATADPPDFATFYADNCAVCHGANRDGVGRAPALTPDELTHEVAEYLEETDDRTHRSIWTRTELDEAAREALFEYLATTPP